MRNEDKQRAGRLAVADEELQERLPRPTTSFRRRAWLQFQRAIDPLAPPKPLKIERR